MTVTHRKRQYQPDEIVGWYPEQRSEISNTYYVAAINEPGLQFECDSCSCDLTHSIRIKCADSACEAGDGIDICPACFCSGKEFGNHKRNHPYRVIVSYMEYFVPTDMLMWQGIALVPYIRRRLGSGRVCIISLGNVLISLERQGTLIDRGRVAAGDR